MTFRRWVGIASIALGSSGWMAAGNVYAGTDGYSVEDLKLQTAGALVDLCTIESGHQDYTAGRAFCYGFFEGAIRYAEAISGAKHQRDLVCPPPGTTRLQAVEEFVSYIKANPQYASEGPIDAVYRALIPRWPCADS